MMDGNYPLNQNPGLNKYIRLTDLSMSWCNERLSLSNLNKMVLTFKFNNIRKDTGFMSAYTPDYINLHHLSDDDYYEAQNLSSLSIKRSQKIPVESDSSNIELVDQPKLRMSHIVNALVLQKVKQKLNTLHSMSSKFKFNNDNSKITINDLTYVQGGIKNA